MRSSFLLCSRLGLVLAAMCLPQPLMAQELDGGFRNVATPHATGDERTSQTNLWVLEVQFKSLRLIRLPNPKTGEASKGERVLYLVYRVVNRGQGETKDATDTAPINVFDPDVAAPLFVPEFSLITNDNDQQKIYNDVVVPEAQKLISAREKLKLLNSVEIVGSIPEVTPAGAKPAEEKARTGVAMWRGVDPAADRFTIMMGGFSNGYKLVRGPVSFQALVDRVAENKLTFSDQVWDSKSPWRAASATYNLFDNKKPAPANPDASIWFYTTTSDRIAAEEEKPIIWRKTLVQRFWRPGDQFDQQEKEYRLEGDAEWIFQPEDQPIPVVMKPVAAAKPAQ